MPTVYFNSQACHISDLIDANDELTSEFSRVNGIGPSGRVYQGQSFTLDLSEPSTPSIISIINQQSIHERGWMMKAAASEGEELHREAEFWEKYLSEEALSGVLSLVGASNLASNAKYQNLSNFHKALVRYENALIAIQNPVAANMPGAGPRHQWEAVARRDAIQAYDTLISEHRTALNRLSPEILRARNRGNALSNANRGITLALRSRGRSKPDARIYIADIFQAQRLKKFTQFMARAATPLALAVDATLRTGKVKSVSQADGNWHRESYRQIGGFAGSAFFGGVGAGATGLAFKGTAAGLIALGGPISWALIGCIVVVVAGAGYVSSKGGGKFGEDIGEIIYGLQH